MTVVALIKISIWFVDFVFFFFKQKTAYEMRISDWSSDVCSSDLIGAHAGDQLVETQLDRLADFVGAAGNAGERLFDVGDDFGLRFLRKIGRASCRERVCQYV